MNRHDAIQNDVTWLATCYVAGELPADEAAAFEERLVTDEVACVAVARATALSLNIAASFESEPSGVQQLVPVLKPSTRWAGTALTALAASAVAAAGVALMVQPGDSAGNGLARKDGAARIVAHWMRGEVVRNDLDDDADAFDANDAADLDPPDWMLAALMAADKKSSGEDRNDGDVLEN